MEQLTRDSFLENGVKHTGVSSPTSIGAEKNIKSVVEKDGKFTYKTDDNVEHEVSVNTSNLVTTDTDQTITGDKTFAGNVDKYQFGYSNIAQSRRMLGDDISPITRDENYIYGASGTRIRKYDNNLNVKAEVDSVNGNVIGLYKIGDKLYTITDTLFVCEYNLTDTEIVLNRSVETTLMLDGSKRVCPKMVGNDNYLVILSQGKLFCINKADFTITTGIDCVRAGICVYNNKFYVFQQGTKSEYDPVTNTLINTITIALNHFPRTVPRGILIDGDIAYISDTANTIEDPFDEGKIMFVRKYDMLNNVMLEEKYKINAHGVTLYSYISEIVKNNNILFLITRHGLCALIDLTSGLVDDSRIEYNFNNNIDYRNIIGSLYNVIPNSKDKFLYTTTFNGDGMPSKYFGWFVNFNVLNVKKFVYENELEYKMKEKQDKIIVKKDYNILEWEADGTYADYGFKANIVTANVTPDSYVEVIFGANESLSGNYLPICETSAGVITIYSKVNTAITIPTIVITKGVNV